MKNLLPRALALAAAITLAVTPAHAAAPGDCGAEYVTCVAESVGYQSSDVLHETECYSAYWQCVSKLILIF